MQRSTVWEPDFNNLKARVHTHQVRRPVLDEGAHVCPNLWPTPSVIIVNLDTYFGSASLLEGEQNI